MSEEKNKAIYEALSALKDGESDTLERKRVFKFINNPSKNDEIRKKWKNYWRISQVLESDESRYSDISDKVRDALHSENLNQSNRDRFKNEIFKSLSQVAIAASVAFVTILGVQNFSNNPSLPTKTEIAAETESINVKQDGPAQQYPFGWMPNRDVNLKQASAERYLGPVKPRRKVEPYVIRIISVHESSKLQNRIQGLQIDRTIQSETQKDRE